jgi:hypothetical protein
MNIHLKNERQDCKTGLVRERILEGGGGRMEEAR